MKLDHAVGILTRPELLTEHARRPIKLAVQVFQPGSLGGTPCSEVIGLHHGFDWNAGTLLIETKEPLTRLSPEDVAAIHKSAAGGQSWHAYEAWKQQEAKLLQLRLALNAIKSVPGCPEAILNLAETALTEKPV